jgi:serine/threonine-protein kinase RsbW
VKGARRIERTALPQNLGAFLDFMDDACSTGELSDDVVFALRLAAEEACTNVINHGYGAENAGPLSLTFDHQPDAVVLTVEDRGAPFHPDDVAKPDLTASAEDRALGGLGWHLIRQVMDDVRHEPMDGGGNRLTMVKRLSTDKNMENNN